MDGSIRHQLPERNPKTHAQHRREVFWQITLPLTIAILLLLAAIAAIIFSAVQPATELNRWADVSLMWVILPSLFFAFIILVILVGFVFAITQVLRIIPRYAHLVQLYFEMGKVKVSQITDLVIAPIIKTRSIMAVVRQVGRWKHRSLDEH